MRVAKMPYTRQVRGKTQVKVDVPKRLQPLLGVTALTHFPKPGENEAEIIGGFQRRIEAAQQALDGQRLVSITFPATERPLTMGHFVIMNALRAVAPKGMTRAEIITAVADARRTVIKREEFTMEVPANHSLARDAVVEDGKLVWRRAHNDMAQTTDHKPVDLNDLLEAWATEREIAVSSKRQQRAIMLDFFSCCGFKHADVSRVLEVDAIAYRKNLLARVRADEFGISTAEKRLEAVKSLFRFAFKNAKVTASNPFAEIARFGAKSGTRLPFNDEDRTLILREARKSKSPLIKWANWLAAFGAGSRVAEIAEAMTTDFRTIADGTVVFTIREDTRENKNQTLKNEQSERTIPLHPAIIREGFLDYLDSLPKGPLFPRIPADRDGRRNKNASNIVSKWLRDVVGIKDERKSFHSWRHDVKTRLVNAQVSPARVDYIAGHATQKVGNRYIHHSVSELTRAIGLLPDCE